MTIFDLVNNLPTFYATLEQSNLKAVNFLMEKWCNLQLKLEYLINAKRSHFLK